MAVDSEMFLEAARRAVREGVREQDRKIGLMRLDEEAQSLAYALAEVARQRIADVVAELPA